MIQEIFEEPKAIRDTIRGCSEGLQTVLDEVAAEGFRVVYLSGSGTSYYASLAGQYAMSTLTSLTATAVPASELSSWVSPTARDFLLIAFSQSGESVDVLSAAKTALRMGGKVFAVTNEPRSALAKMANFVLLTRAGRELAVTATKTYVSQLAAIYLLSIELSGIQKVKSEVELDELRKGLKEAPRLAEETLTSTDKVVRELAEKYRHNKFFFILGSGPNYTTALEGALKLKESCNVFAEGYASREFLHGPMRLVDENTPMIFITPPDKALSEHLDLIERFRRLGAPIITVSGGDEKIVELGNSIIISRGLPPAFTPMIYVGPLHLFAYYSSITRGLNPDKPEKITKVVK